MSFARRYLLRLFSCSGDPLGLPSFPTRRSSDLGESQFYDEGRVQHQAVHDPLRGADALADSVDEGGVYDAVQGRHGLGTAEYQRSEEHTSELQSREKLVCRLLLEKKNVERVGVI